MNKALIVTKNHTLDWREISDPVPGPYQALVRIMGCGICSTTDREIIRGRQPYHSEYPCVLGHEGIGQVISIGNRVRTFKPGDWVTRPTAILPGTTWDGMASGWGGFAELGLVTDRQTMMADGDSSFADDYTALRQNVIHAVRPLREMVLGISLAETANWIGNLGSLRDKTVCISGTGIAGLSLALWAKLSGAALVIVLGRRASRLDLAKNIAADEAIDVTQQDVKSAVHGYTKSIGVDFFLEAVGKPDQINLGLSVIKPGGTIALYGVTPGQNYDLTFSAGSGHCQIRQFPACDHLAYPWVMNAMTRGWIPVDQMMTHAWPFADWLQAFEQVERGEVVKGYLEIGAKAHQ